MVAREIFSGSYAEGVHQLTPSFHPGQAPGDLGKVAPAGVLLRQGKGAVVRGDGLDVALVQAGPQGPAILRLAEGGAQT